MQLENTAKPNHHKPRWDATTKVIVIVVLLVLLALAVYFFRVVFIPLIIGGIVAYLLQPVIRAISRATRLSHGIATTLLYAVLLIVLTTLGAALSPLLAEQATALVEELIAFVNRAETQAGAEINILGFTLSTQALVTAASAGVQEFIRSAPAQPITLLAHGTETILLIVFTILAIFYLTRDAEQILTWAQHLIPPHYHQDASTILGEVDQVWSAFFRGQVILALVMMVIVAGVSALLGLPQPLLLGVLAGLLEFLPSLGHGIWLSIALTLALTTGSTWLPIANHFVFALLVIGAYIAFTQFDLNYLIPRIIGERVRLHPLVVIGGIIIGFKVGGVLGVTLAAPTIATLRILGRYIYALLFDMDPFPHNHSAAMPQPDADTAEANPDIDAEEGE